MELLTASWVIPIEGPPLEGGGLVVSGGRIRAVGPAGELARAWSGAPRVDLEGCALVPALINAHAHLELTGLGDAPPGGDFVGWVVHVIERKRQAAPEAYREGIRRGARECLEKGQALVADVLTSADGWDAYPTEGPQIRLFPEVIAPHAEAVSPALARALSARAKGPARLAGLSPHAPYTVCAAAYRECRRELKRRRWLLMTHVAESSAEVEFCLNGSGDIPERLYPRVPAQPPEPPGEHPLEWLDGIGVLDSRALLVHLAHLEREHVELLAKRGARAVLCPRSNRHLSGRAAPGRELLDAGVAVGLGTDSRLSAGDLDLWKEIACAVEDYGWSPEEALTAATLGGARALGVGAERGAFAPGRRADILAVSLSPGRDLWDRALADPAPAIVWIDGSVRFSRPRFLPPHPES